MKRQNIVLSVSIALLAIVLTGCPERKRISDVNSDPGRYMDKEVTIVGRVTRSYGAVGTGVFEIDDGTGRMWVFSDRYGVPSKDTYIGVSGKIIPGVTYAGRNYGTGMRETRRHKRENR